MWWQTHFSISGYFKLKDSSRCYCLEEILFSFYTTGQTCSLTSRSNRCHQHLQVLSLEERQTFGRKLPWVVLTQLKSFSLRFLLTHSLRTFSCFIDSQKPHNFRLDVWFEMMSIEQKINRTERELATLRPLECTGAFSKMLHEHVNGLSVIIIIPWVIPLAKMFFWKGSVLQTNSTFTIHLTAAKHNKR